MVGERCSGTNLARVLIKKHLPIQYSGWQNYGWKHGFPQKVGYAKNTLLIVLFREPIAWISSLYRKPWHATFKVQDRSFSEFIREPWETIVFPATQLGLPKDHPIEGHPLQYDRHPLTGKLFETPIDLRNIKNESFLGFRNRSVNVAFVKMETLISDPKLFLSCLAIAFDLPLPKKVQLPKKTLGQKKRLVPLVAPPPKEIELADLNFIRSRLNSEIETELGYFRQNVGAISL